ncbi:MAG: hypothetical protein M3Y87_11270 [Myxococcota bacterium]|nr:hypothetical protein [Myxococcota bacterium]
MRNWSLVLCACALTIVGCGDPEPMTGSDAGTRDSGAPVDSSTLPVDSSTPDDATVGDDAATDEDGGVMMDDASVMMDDGGPPAASFSTDVWPILMARCVSCHGGGSGGLTFNSAATAHAALVGPDRERSLAMCTEAEAPLERVTPGDPDASFLVVKISGTPPAGCGSLMPLSGGPLSAAEIATIRSWIEGGALND